MVSSGVARDAQQASGLAKAARTTGAVSTAKVAVAVRTTPGDGGPSLTVTSSGEIDAAKGQAYLIAEVDGALGGRSGDTSIETIYDGDTVYVKAPFIEFFSDQPWIKITSPKLTEVAKELAGQAANPGDIVALLEGAGGPVTTIGTEEVRGVATRRVSVELDVTEVLDQVSGDRLQAIEAYLADRGVSLEDLAPLPAEAWIDDDGYVRRFTIEFDLAELGKLRQGEPNGPTSKAPGTITETIELYDFNEPVDIAIPPASEVSTFDPSKLFGPGKGKSEGEGD